MTLSSRSFRQAKSVSKDTKFFLRQALDYSLKMLHQRCELDKTNHLSGKQLLNGIRLYAIDQYGPMA